MPVIANHHDWKDADYRPSCDWPADTYVQWGSSGVVFGRERSYKTAFFEAFPKSGNAGGFIRGEGDSIAAAEMDAFSKFQHENACNHLWGRGSYTNGGQVCRRCRAFRSGHAKPIVRIGTWRQPISRLSDMLMLYDGTGASTSSRRLWLRKKHFGVQPEALQREEP